MNEAPLIIYDPQKRKIRIFGTDVIENDKGMDSGICIFGIVVVGRKQRVFKSQHDSKKIAKESENPTANAATICACAMTIHNIPKESGN